MTPDEFKTALLTIPVPDIVSAHITNSDPGPFVLAEHLEFVATKIRTAFAINAEHSVQPIVVGSAKLGFSFTEKNYPVFKPRYRSYVAGESDIDMAICSPALYGMLWKGIAHYGAAQDTFPWRTESLGDYMLHGWIRPDKIPVPPPPGCQAWFDLMSTLNSSEFFRFKKLRCGIYQSKFFLELYQRRGLVELKNIEMLKAKL